MFLIGKSLLVFLGLVLVLATPPSDFNRRHVFHPEWPAHARYHCAAYAFLNIGFGTLGTGLLLYAHAGDRLLLALGSGILAWSSVSLLLAALIPGTSPIADGERVWRKLPVSVWSTIAYLILVGVGAVMVLKPPA